MASRDLTEAFVLARNELIHRRRKAPSGRGKMAPMGMIQGKGGSLFDDKHGLFNDDLALHDENFALDDGPAPAPPPPVPSYLGVSERVEASLRRISADMERLHGLHAVRVGSVFALDLHRRDEEIDALTERITGQFRSAERGLKGIVAEEHTGNGADGTAASAVSDEELTVRRNVQRNLARRIQEMGLEFRKRQRAYMGDVADQKGRGTEAQFGIDIEEAERARQHVESGMDSHHLSLVEEMEDAVLQRDEEINKIAQSITDLSTMFKELAVLVIDQGTILDRIDYNMEVVVERTKDGVKQLEKAERKQKSARSMKCIICQLVTIATLVVILILKHM
eukprot:CAMPEP_0194272864 /NCGR_PEP_ID=MMETSP0169-20130528/6331_1 /TAXON_ID=218684 /ORGANISM="Corethron pennatum, Strain L29A3" /LENGTH=336 /DNA_ID=CAMNT_0039015643 /DNA_START=40 /DNA_END=1050 /DNA_ORIENTATION=+